MFVTQTKRSPHLSDDAIGERSLSMTHTMSDAHSNRNAYVDPMLNQANILKYIQKGIGPST